MDKRLIALPALALCFGAAAQSSLTIFGVIDASLTHGRGTGSGSASRTQLLNSEWQGSRIGVRGVEDLGGGLSASFFLDAGVANDDGLGIATNTSNQPGGAAPAAPARTGLTFNRRSTLSLAGPWGELRLGRDYTSHFLNLTNFDPFWALGIGSIQAFQIGLGGVTAARASNVVGYILPAQLGGFYGQAQYYLGENPHDGSATQGDGSGASVRAGWREGRLNVAAASGVTRYAAGDIRIGNVAAEYDFGPARVTAVLSRDSVASASRVTGRGAMAGIVVPVGVHEVRAAYSRYRKSSSAGDPTSSKAAVGWIHNLSKRTNLYAVYAHVANRGGAAQALAGAATAVNRPSSGYEIGLKHSF